MMTPFFGSLVVKYGERSLRLRSPITAPIEEAAMTKEQSSKFIVYELCYPEGEPFYVGKGRPTRPRRHINGARRGEDSHKDRIIRKIERQGNAVAIEIVLETDSNDEAMAEEVRRIACYRSAGIALTNKTDGGEGNLGWHPSAEARAKVGAANRGRKHTEEHNRKISEAGRGRSPSKETRRKLSESNSRAKRGKPLTPLQYERMVARMRSPEMRQNIRESIKGFRHSAETREKMSETHRNMPGRPQTEETKEKLRTIHRGRPGRPHSEETRARISAANKGRKLTDEQKAKISLARKAYYAAKRGQLPLEELADVG